MEWKGNSGRISESKKWIFKWRRKETMLFDDLTCSESEFQRVNWKRTSPNMSFNRGNRKQVKTRWTELSGLWCWERMEKSLIGNGTEFENDARLNREPMKRFHEWNRMKIKRGDRVTTLAKQFWTNSSFRISLDAMLQRRELQSASLLVMNAVAMVLVTEKET